MGKRLRRDRSICSCKPPCHSNRNTARSSFNWFEEDLWTEIAKFLDGRSLVKLAATCRWFLSVLMHDSIWRFACLRDLQVPDPGPVRFKWSKLYASLLDWMPIGAFYFDPKVALLAERLSLPVNIRHAATDDKTLEASRASILWNIKKGVWVLVQCPVCELHKCDGTMQTLDARHIELFMCEDFQNGSWKHELVESHKYEKPMDAASGAIFDLKHIHDDATAGVFNLKLWTGAPTDYQSKAMITFHSVAINTNLQVKEGVISKYYKMRDGPDGDAASIRISQQLL